MNITEYANAVKHIVDIVKKNSFTEDEILEFSDFVLEQLNILKSTTIKGQPIQARISHYGDKDILNSYALRTLPNGDTVLQETADFMDVMTKSGLNIRRQKRK